MPSKMALKSCEFSVNLFVVQANGRLLYCLSQIPNIVNSELLVEFVD